MDTTFLCYTAGGGATFAFCKHFLALAISNWWILAASVWFVVAAFVPGGFTLTNWLLVHNDLMQVPMWAWIVSVVADIGILITVISVILSTTIDSSKKR